MTPTTFRVKAACLIADGVVDRAGYAHDKSRVRIPNAVVPVTQNYQAEKRLGIASLSWEGDVLMADMTLVTDLPLELIEETTPCAGGAILEVVMNESQNAKSITCEITALSLCLSQNVDPRVKSIKAQRKSR